VYNTFQATEFSLIDLLKGNCSPSFKLKKKIFQIALSNGSRGRTVPRKVIGKRIPPKYMLNNGWKRAAPMNGRPKESKRGQSPSAIRRLWIPPWSFLEWGHCTKRVAVQLRLSDKVH
tara:strand:- start:302 stop:652 length:351 start_codon:yes stop_codon:yes gene_type:complete